ncbi:MULTISPECIES: hypothetical protein [unclassified Mesorhizobium]|nr:MULTISPECIES: hypothetical protein [unclassified Mesorhizobium]
MAGAGDVIVYLSHVQLEIVVERHRKLIVHRAGVSRFECRLKHEGRLMSLNNRSGVAVVSAELAHHFFFEIDIEIALFEPVIGGWGLRLGGRLRPDRLARVESHDPGQFRERIIVSDVVVVGYSQLGSVCHYCSRTRTHSDAMDVA